MFVIIDGIDGCGKGTIADALAAARRADGVRVFDLREFAKREHRLPEPAELTACDAIISAEPTHTWVGAAIREELIRDNGRPYTDHATAEAYALDRLILYERVLLPARMGGKDIIQERSVTSSIVYQSQGSGVRGRVSGVGCHGSESALDGVPPETICTLEGNALALSNPPDLCIIVSTEPPRAIQRLQLRSSKRDAAIFEKLSVLTALHESYHSAWFRDLLAKYGWRVEYLDANGAVEDAVARARSLLASLEAMSKSKVQISNEVQILK